MQDDKVSRTIRDALTIAGGGITRNLFSEKFEAYAQEHGLSLENVSEEEYKTQKLIDRLNDLLGRD